MSLSVSTINNNYVSNSVSSYNINFQGKQNLKNPLTKTQKMKNSLKSIPTTWKDSSIIGKTGILLGAAGIFIGVAGVLYELITREQNFGFNAVIDALTGFITAMGGNMIVLEDYENQMKNKEKRINKK